MLIDYKLFDYYFIGYAFLDMVEIFRWLNKSAWKPFDITTEFHNERCDASSDRNLNVSFAKVQG